MDQALELLPGDYWRWYLMANAPESSDAAFTWEQFKDTINADLANVLGNFVNRIMKFAETKMGGVVPMEGEPGPLENELYEDLEERLARISDFHDQMEFRKAAAETRGLWVRGNEYLQLAAPWTALKTDPVRAAMVVRTGLNLCALFAATAFPFIPESAQAIRDGLGLKGDPAWPLGAKLFELVSPGAPIAVPPVLFRKIEDADVVAWSERFGGG
jgi:methionyl-tRNA synthetase